MKSKGAEMTVADEMLGQLPKVDEITRKIEENREELKALVKLLRLAQQVAEIHKDAPKPKPEKEKP
jgi:hypothetical protein